MIYFSRVRFYARKWGSGVGAGGYSCSSAELFLHGCRRGESGSQIIRGSLHRGGTTVFLANRLQELTAINPDSAGRGDAQPHLVLAELYLYQGDVDVVTNSDALAKFTIDDSHSNGGWCIGHHPPNHIGRAPWCQTPYLGGCSRRQQGVPGRIR